jgi:hypothetical protein
MSLYTPVLTNTNFALVCCLQVLVRSWVAGSGQAQMLSMHAALGSC